MLFLLHLDHSDLIKFCAAKRAHFAFAINMIQQLSTVRALHLLYYLYVFKYFYLVVKKISPLDHYISIHYYQVRCKSLWLTF